jgi:hypothetical protein
VSHISRVGWVGRTPRQRVPSLNDALTSIGYRHLARLVNSVERHARTASGSTSTACTSEPLMV